MERNLMKELADKIEKVVRCPVCLEKLRVPVVVCENGHGTCSECRRNRASCSICSAQYSTVSVRIVEQILPLLPQTCIYSKKGCSSLATANHSQYCEYRPMKCILGPNYSCHWNGTVKGWINHAQNSHIIHDYPDLNSTQITCYENFDSWIVNGSCHYFDEKYFQVLAVKTNGMFYQTVKLVPLIKPNCQYFLETTIRSIASEEVLYRFISNAGLLLVNDCFEDYTPNFVLKDLKGAMSRGNLVMYRQFKKHNN